MKIKIKINFAESNIKHPSHFENLLAANIYLMRVAEENRGKLGYTKIDFTATFEDGETYQGRFDCHGADQRQETSNGSLCFLQHMKDCIAFLAGIAKPDHLTQEQYEEFTDSNNPEVCDWLNRLEIKI